MFQMQEYYDLLLAYPDWFAKDEPLYFKQFIKDDIRVLIPDKDKEGRPVYICKLGK